MTQIDFSSQLGRREHEIRKEPIEEEPLEIYIKPVGSGENTNSTPCVKAHEIFLKEKPISTTYDAVIIDIDRLINSLLKILRKQTCEFTIINLKKLMLQLRKVKKAPIYKVGTCS